MVVVAFFANDYEDNLAVPLFVLDEGRLIENKYEHVPGMAIQNFLYSIPPARWLSENSYFYPMLRDNVWRYLKKLRNEEGGEQYVLPTNVTHSDKSVSLAAALLERMQRFCDERGFRFIVVDIPDERGELAFASSLSPLLRTRLDAAAVEYIDSEALFSAYAGSTELHVPHGHRHISKFTHAMIGVEIGRRMLAGGIAGK